MIKISILNKLIFGKTIHQNNLFEPGIKAEEKRLAQGLAALRNEVCRLTVSLFYSFGQNI